VSKLNFYGYSNVEEEETLQNTQTDIRKRAKCSTSQSDGVNERNSPYFIFRSLRNSNVRKRKIAARQVNR
jgi:hypothetical protein